MSLMSEVGQKAFNLGVPLAIHMDVTYRCNERCVHCYLDHDDHGEMTTAEIKDVLDQLAEAGVFFLTLSGGEGFMRRDFFEIVEHARRLMFSVKIKTNAVMIHEKEARRIRELGVDTIQISVYSHRPEVHDAITKLPHSFERTIKAIRFLREQGLRVTIANVLMTVNSSDHSGVQKLAAELGAQYTLDPTITPMMDGDTSVLSLREKNLRKFFAILRWSAARKSSARLPSRRLRRILRVTRAARAILSATFRPTAMFFPACSFRFPREIFVSRSFWISGIFPRR